MRSATRVPATALGGWQHAVVDAVGVEVGCSCVAAARPRQVGVTRGRAAPPLLWAHGMGSSRRHEERHGIVSGIGLAPGCTRYDAAGHGQSDGCGCPETYTWAALGSVMGQIAASVAGPVVLGGASMGCATALHAAVDHPGGVHALVLVSPPTTGADRAGAAVEYEVAAQLVEQDGVAALTSRWGPIVPQHLRDVSEEPITFRPDVRQDILPAVLRGAARSELPAASALRELVTPTLVLAWAGDASHPLASARLLAQLLGGDLVEARSAADLRGWPAVVAGFLAGLPVAGGRDRAG